MRVYDITTQGLPCIFKLTSFLDTPSYLETPLHANSISLRMAGPILPS